MTRPTADFLALLTVLTGHRVEFVVVGGVAAVLQGAPLATVDLDIVHSRAADNLERLEVALQELEARDRWPKDRLLQPRTSLLSTAGHHLLATRHGPLDLLGTIGAGDDYGHLRGRAVDVQVAPGVIVSVLGLEALIESKELLGREKDKAVLPVLRRVLTEREKG